MENLRSCDSITGYDYLGGIDTHWHLIGYPCGIFNEFYEEKFGESIGDVRRYNNESVLLCSALRYRNRFAGSRFAETLRLSYFGRGEGAITGEWSFTNSAGNVLAGGTFAQGGMIPGRIVTLTDAAFDLPALVKGEKCVLRAAGHLNGERIENEWLFWVFPPEKAEETSRCRIADRLTPELIDFAAAGGSVLLTGDFPAETYGETFRTHTSGRSLGHAGALLDPHPLWEKFPVDEYMDWQFYPMMSGSSSIVYDDGMPEFRPLMELIPSFKLIRFKSMLSEFQVGEGRIMMTGLVLDDDEPAGRCLKKEIVSYLTRRDFQPAPRWEVRDLKDRLEKDFSHKRREVAIDAGGRPME